MASPTTNIVNKTAQANVANRQSASHASSGGDEIQLFISQVLVTLCAVINSEAYGLPLVELPGELANIGQQGRVTGCCSG